LIRIDTEPVIHSDGDFASVAFLRIKRAILEDKGPTSLDLKLPPLLSEKFQSVQTACSGKLKIDPVLEIQDSVDVTKPRMLETGTLDGSSVVVTHNDRWVSVANVQAPAIFRNMSVDQEVKECFLILQSMYQMPSRNYDYPYIEKNS